MRDAARHVEPVHGHDQSFPRELRLLLEALYGALDGRGRLKASRVDARGADAEEDDPAVGRLGLVLVALEAEDADQGVLEVPQVVVVAERDEVGAEHAAEKLLPYGAHAEELGGGEGAGEGEAAGDVREPPPEEQRQQHEVVVVHQHQIPVLVQLRHHVVEPLVRRAVRVVSLLERVHQLHVHERRDRVQHLPQNLTAKLAEEQSTHVRGEEHRCRLEIRLQLLTHPVLRGVLHGDPGPAPEREARVARG